MRNLTAFSTDETGAISGCGDLNLTGNVIFTTGAPHCSFTPVYDTQLTSKRYVDSAVAAGGGAASAAFTGTDLSINGNLYVAGNSSFSTIRTKNFYASSSFIIGNTLLKIADSTSACEINTDLSCNKVIRCTSLYINGALFTVGTQGPQGIQGNTGATGAQGPQGVQGIQGNTGAQGAQGVQGLQGNTGATGPTGPQGVQGVQGATGATGATGPAGTFATNSNPYITGYYKTGLNSNGEAGFLWDSGNYISLETSNSADTKAGAVNGISPATGDGSSDSTFNVGIRTWNGVGIINTSNDGNTGSNRVKHYWGARDGNYTAKGTINCAALSATGAISGASVSVTGAISGASISVTGAVSAASTSTGKITITESTGTTASATDGSLIIKHNNDYGSSSIVFPSKINYAGDYGYIQYSDNYSGNNENAKLVIGTENDGGSDFIILNPCAGGGRVGINTYSPSNSLEVNGTFSVNNTCTFSGIMNITTNNLCMNDKQINLRGTSNSDSNHYIKYDGTRDGPLISGYQGVSFHIQSTEVGYFTSSKLQLGGDVYLTLGNSSKHNVKISSMATISSSSTVSPNGYSDAISNYVLTSNSLTISVDCTNILDGAMLNFANVAGSNMSFKIVTGQSQVLFERDNNSYGSTQTLSLTNTRRIQFIYCNSQSKLIEMFRYP